MKLPPNHPPKSSMSYQTKAVIILAFMGIGILLLILLVTVMFRGKLQSGTPSQQEQTPLAYPTVPPGSLIVPTVIVPTEACQGQTFGLGATTLQVQSIIYAPDGSLTMPPSAPGIAYWLDTTEGNHLVILSPTPENISLAALAPGTPAKVIWTDCSSWTFDLTAPETNPVNISTLPGQLTSGLTIFFQTDEVGNGWIVRGELTEMTLPQ